MPRLRTPCRTNSSGAESYAIRQLYRRHPKAPAQGAEVPKAPAQGAEVPKAELGQPNPGSSGPRVETTAGAPGPGTAPVVDGAISVGVAKVGVTGSAVLTAGNWDAVAGTEPSEENDGGFAGTCCVTGTSAGVFIAQAVKPVPAAIRVAAATPIHPVRMFRRPRR